MGRSGRYRFRLGPSARYGRRNVPAFRHEPHGSPAAGIVLALGLPYQDNQWGAVYGPQSHENVYELFYSAHIARAMALQPDFQYIQRPSATTTFHDAAVLGVQFTVVL